MDEERIKAFLTDLTALTRKHGVVIASCCGDEPAFLRPIDGRENFVYRYHERESGLEFTPIGGYSWDMWIQNSYVYPD